MSKNRIKRFTQETNHTFTWKPIKEEPTDLSLPIIFLTDRGAIVTFNKSGKGGVSWFSGRAISCNAVGWAYQKDLIP